MWRARLFVREWTDFLNFARQHGLAWHQKKLEGVPITTFFSVANNMLVGSKTALL